MALKLILIAGTTAALLLQGCDDRTNLSCPDASEATIKEWIRAHKERNAPKYPHLEVVGKGWYDTGTNWWIVPVDAGARKLTALIDCKGGLEFSVREL